MASLKIPGYRLAKVLGKGAQGIVVKGMREADGQYIAIKVLKVANLNDEFFEKRFSREAQILLSVDHPNIVEALDVGRLTEGPYQGPYLVLEYVDGKTVLERIKEKRMDEEPALGYLRQAAEGLLYIHQHGMVHRDLKPENLMIAKDGVVKIMDLGLAKIVTDDKGLTVTGEAFGTPGHMSPEAALNTKDADIRSDIFSLGTTLYQMLTRRLPFYDDNVAKLLNKLMTEKPKPPKAHRADLSDRVDALVMKMIAHEREMRQQHPEQLLEDIDRVLEGRMPRKARSPRPEKKKGWFGRGK